MIKKIISKSSIDTVKNITIGFLLGTVVALSLTVLRFYIDKEVAEDKIYPSTIKDEIPKDDKKLKRNMPVFPDRPLTNEEALSLASLFPELFTDKELINLLIQ
tara:strand:- start:406 stop:714 length:309 start_codon:yes stop_codon:yes gene_type:complete